MHGRISQRYVGPIMVAMGLSIATVCQADIIFTLGNNPQPDEENILFVDDTGTTVFGTTQDSGLDVFFTGTETLVANGGQARIEAEDGSFNFLNFGVVEGTFGDFILNPRILGTGGTSGNIHVVVEEPTGDTSSFDYTAGTGNNFLTILAINGQRISNITLTSTAPLELVDFRQPRISRVASCPAESTDPLCTGIPLIVPEPMPLSLVGIGLIVLGALRFRSRAS